MKDTSTKSKYYAARGRRKRAHAVVKLLPGTGVLYINSVSVDNDAHSFTSPLELIGENGKWDIHVHVRGGGIIGQNDSIRLGIARALISYNQEYKTTLRKAGMVTRDPREKERKKPGLKRARRAPQWSKR